MSDPPDDEIDYLLSRGSLASAQRERILGNLLASAHAVPAPERKRRFGWWGASALGLAAGAVALLLWVRAPRRDQPVHFATKGHGATEGPFVEMTCLGASAKACPIGSELAFSIEGGRPEGGLVSAYADPLGRGERVWYLTNERLSAPVPSGGSSMRVAPKVARVGDEHSPGPYRVTVIVTDDPVARAAATTVLQGGNVLARAEFELEVVP
jgi:hypothetical protein